MALSIDPSKEEEFKVLQSEGKKLAAEGRLLESLQKFELAKAICPAPKVLQRIEKIKEFLIQDNSINQTIPLTSNLDEFRSNRNVKVSSKRKSSGQKRFSGPKVLNDIQNVQKLNAPRIASKSADLSPISQSKFRQLKKVAKESAYAGKYDEAINYFRKALDICDCPNVKRYVQEVQKVMSSDNEVSSKPEDIPAKADKQEIDSHSVQKDTYTKVCMNTKNDTAIHSHGITENKASHETVAEFSQESKAIERLEPEKSDLENKLSKVKTLYDEARDLAADGRLTSALKVLQKAQSIHETQKVQKKIDKLKELIEADFNDAESNNMVKLTDDFSIFHDIYKKLYPYQREGVAWMWKLYKMHRGGVLGDDMGLGKTFQVIAFISGMIDADLVKHVLIIMPVSLIQNWTREFKKWCPGILVHDFHSGTKKERERNLLRVQKRGHVLLTSYGMILNNVQSMTELDGREFVWDYVILDEGHKIKNPTKTTKAVYDIPSKNRLVLSGTPIQNNLRELWSLFDFVHQGTLLGSQKTFKLHYENPITRAREKDATAGEKQLGTEMAENLKSLIKPYFLRRTKDEIWGKKNEDMEQLSDEMDKMMISKLNSKKNDLILWTFMSKQQIEIYQNFLHSDAVKSILVSKRSPLVELTVLKKICDHPRLLSQRACLQLGLDGEKLDEDLLRNLDDESTMASSIDNVSDETLLAESGKLKLVINLLENLKTAGHRTLIFSLSRKILDMIHRILVNRKWKVMRLDGTISKTEERERRIQKFQNDSSYPVFLLTTQVGGVGITLTAADRVIIYDPSWNPATDAQAVDRVYRIGQQRDVIVYRLITCGSVEEKIYRRQIFKDSITRQATGVADPYRYFSKQELRELFTLDNPLFSATQAQLAEMHSSQRQTNDELENHIKYLQTLNIFGISHHDLMFSKSIQDHSEDNDQCAVSDNFIKKQVATAHELIKMEASVVAEGIRLAGTYNRPYQETVPIPKKISLKDNYKPPVLPDVIDLTEDAQDSTLKFKADFHLKGNDHIEIYPVSPDRRYENNKDGKEGYSILSKIKSFFLADEKADSNLRKNKESPSNSMANILKADDSRESNHAHLNTSCNVEKLQKSVECFETSPVKKEIDPVFEEEKIVQGLVDHLDKEDQGGVHSLSLNEQNTSVELELLNTSCNVEKLRKSVGCFETSPVKEVIDPVFEEEKIVQGLVDHHDKEDQGNVYSLSLNEQNTSVEIEPPKLPDELQEKFKTNLTQFMQEDDLDDISFDPEESIRCVKGSRRSCARKSTFMMSDSDTDHEIPDNSTSNMNLDSVSEEATDEEGDASNSASLSFVPDSATNTPETVKPFTMVTQSVSETPPRAFGFGSGSATTNTPLESISPVLRKLEGSVRRITPLKVDKNLSDINSSFSHAMANSLCLSPQSSPNNENSYVPPSSKNSVHNSTAENMEVLNSDGDDSPIKLTRKKKAQIHSDSEESDEEPDYNESAKAEAVIESETDQTFYSTHAHNESVVSEVIEDDLKPNKQLSDNDENIDSENSDTSEGEISLSESEYSGESEYEEQQQGIENSHNAVGNSSTLILTSDSDESDSVFSQNGHDTDSEYET